MISIREDETLSPEKMRAIGFEVKSGHLLKCISAYGRFDCECGMFTTYLPVSDGMVGRASDGRVPNSRGREYSQHIHLQDTAKDTMIHVGTIIKPRVTWKLNIFTNLHPECTTYGTSQWREQWLYGENMRPYWVLGAEKKKNSRILGIYTHKTGAIVAAHSQLDKAEAQGFETVRAFTLESQAEAVSHSIHDELLHLLSRVDETVNTATKFALLEQLQSIEQLMPVIQAKAADLRKELTLTDGITI